MICLTRACHGQLWLSLATLDQGSTMASRGGEVRVYTHSSVFNKLKREEILTARYLLRLWKSKIFNSSVHTQVREVKFFNSSVHTQVKEVKNF